jgi:hypothetical protein
VEYNKTSEVSDKVQQLRILTVVQSEMKLSFGDSIASSLSGVNFYGLNFYYRRILRDFDFVHHDTGICGTETILRSNWGNLLLVLLSSSSRRCGRLLIERSGCTPRPLIDL